MSKENGSGKLRGEHPTEKILYDRLVDAVIDKHLRAGQHLNEVKLAEAYDVPRSRVRRVLERLRDEDVVTWELNRGAFICRPTIDDAVHVFEARKYLECSVVRLACERITPDGVAKLRNHLERERAAFLSHQSDVNRIAAEFHMLLAELAGNRVFLRILPVLIRRGVLIQSVYERKTGVLCLTHDHQHLVDHIEAGRGDEAAREMALHIDHIFSSLDLTEKRRNEVDVYEFARG